MGGYRRFCAECGSELKQRARFCANCGHAAADDPQPAATGEHEVTTRDLPVPAPSPAWDASAAPPGGALFPPPGSAFPPHGAPFPAEDPPFPPAGSRVPPQDAGFPPQDVPYPAAGPPGDRGTLPSLQPELPDPTRTSTPRPGPPGDRGTLPTPRPELPDSTRTSTPRPGPPGGRQGVPYPPARPPGPTGSFGFPGADTSPGFRDSGFPPPGPTSTSKGLALPAARPAPAVAARLPAGPPPAGPAPGAAASPALAATDTAQFSQTWADDVGFSPQWAPAAPADEAGPPARTPERSRRMLAIGLFALVAAVIVVPALLIAHSFPSITGGGTAAAQPTAKQPARGSTAAAPTQRSAAAGLATLLAQTAADRSSIVNAVGAVKHCTAALGQAPQVFQNSAASRQHLLQQLAELPGRSALPAPMLQELTGAWQASAAVDTDLGRWAQDEAAGGCKPNDHADANYQAASTPDLQATNDKTAFVSMWNAIAAKYGLTRYETSQL